MTDCRCADEASIRPLPVDVAYDRLKHVLHWGPKRFQHPRYVGQREVAANAANGGAIIVTYRGEDVACALVNARLSVLRTLHVSGAHRGHGLGSVLVDHLDCAWVRALDGGEQWFARRGYDLLATRQAKRHRVHVMVASDVRRLAGTLADRLGDVCRCDRQADLAAPLDRVG